MARLAKISKTKQTTCGRKIVEIKMSANTGNAILIVILGVVAVVSIGCFSYTRTTGNHCIEISSYGFIKNWKLCN